MSRMNVAIVVAVVGMFAAFVACIPTGHSQQGQETIYAKWKNGPPAGPDYFPIAVWLQDPRYASRYKEAGFSLYVGLWRGLLPALVHRFGLLFPLSLRRGTCASPQYIWQTSRAEYDNIVFCYLHLGAEFLQWCH